jgi:hypothetical protein
MAELSLAIIGLAAQAFSSIVASYGFLSKAQGLKEAAPIILWKLRIQEIRFRVWGRHWGVDQGNLDEQLRKEDLLDDVLGILNQMKDLLEDGEKLRAKYGVRKELEPSGDSIDAIANDQQRSTVSRMKPTEKPSWKLRFLWAVTDEAKFKTLVNDLKDFNDGLQTLLRSPDILFLDNAVQSEILRSTEQVGQLRLIQDACVQTDTTTPSHSLRRVNQVYDDLRLYARSKELQVCLQEEPLPSLGRLTAFARCSVYKPRSTLMIVPDNSPSNVRIIAQYRPDEASPAIKVFVEWKDYSTDSEYHILIMKRMDNLARLLSEGNPKLRDLLLLQCVAYVEDTRLPRFGFAYNLPPNTSLSPPVTLLNLLSRRFGSHVPDLGERFSLAQALAVALLRFHDCGWIHGAVRSSNVIFFKNQTSDEIILRQPYIMGFTYSRPSDPSESTLEYSRSSLENDLYRHPQVACYFKQSNYRARYRQWHDLYSVGVILLEVGLWEEVRALWKDHYTHERFHRKLLDSYVPRLGQKMGAIYRDVVRLLLSLELGNDGNSETETGRDVYWRVVGQLQFCKA